MSLNSALMDVYAACATPAEVIAAQQAHLDAMQVGLCTAWRSCLLGAHPGRRTCHALA